MTSVNGPSGGIELFFSYIPRTSAVRVLTNITGLVAYSATGASLLDISLKITKEIIDTNQYIVVETELDSTCIDKANYLLAPDVDIEYKIRVFIYDEYISVYCNDLCVYSYSLGGVGYPGVVTASLKVTGSDPVSFSNVRRVELKDQREAIYVDYEANTESAIQSIIQQRPIEITAAVDRQIEFTYSAIKDNIGAIYVKTYSGTTEDNLQMSSDGIVYYSDVGVSINEDTAEQVGFITRMYRLSELSSGAITAAAIYQEKALQKRNMVSISSRLDPRLEIRDILVFDLTVTGTGRSIVRSIIVEGIQIKTENGSFKMSVTGRKYS